jgi:terminase large subunit-like protein
MNSQLPNQLEPCKLKLRLLELQYQIFHCPTRFRVVVAGRRSGKTELALVEIVRAAQKTNQLIWYVGPNLAVAEDIIWDRLKTATRPLWAKMPRETKLRIDLKNGSAIIVKGGFKPENLRGRGLDFVVLDEAADLKADAWNLSLRPALADRLGRAIFFGTPKGRNHLFDYFEIAQSHPGEWASFQFTTAQGRIVNQNELESIGRNMDANLFRQELEAQFTAIGNYRAYLSFQRESNLRPSNIRDVRFEPAVPLIWSLDFNVDPMSMLLMQRVGDQVNVLEEIVVRSNENTTEAACRIFAEHATPYAAISGRIYGALQVHIYGDASGSQRRTAATDTDWNLIRAFFRHFHKGTIEISCRFANINPLVRDRINCVNARLRNTSGQPQLFISPGCKELIRDFEEVCFKVDSTGAPTNELNKSDRKRTHMSDALGYYISQVFPLRGFNKL